MSEILKSEPVRKQNRECKRWNLPRGFLPRTRCSRRRRPRRRHRKRRRRPPFPYSQNFRSPSHSQCYPPSPSLVGFLVFALILFGFNRCVSLILFTLISLSKTMKYKFLDLVVIADYDFVETTYWNQDQGRNKSWLSRFCIISGLWVLFFFNKTFLLYPFIETPIEAQTSQYLWRHLRNPIRKNICGRFISENTLRGWVLWRIYGSAESWEKMDVFLKVAIQLPIFSPLVDHNPTRERSSTELRFSRWNNANAEKFNQRRRTIHEIEDEICRTRRYTVADNIINTATAAAISSTSETFKSLGTPSAPSQPSIPGKKSKYSKPPPKPKPLLDWHPVVSRVERLEFLPGPENVKIGEDGVSYVVDGAPFDFRFSYTETPKANPVKLREPPYAPFGPPTLPRPWTGRNPVPPSKTTVTDFHLLSPPLSDEEGAELVRLAVPIWESREQVLGEPLTENEINRLVKRAGKSSRQLHIGIFYLFITAGFLFLIL